MTDRELMELAAKAAGKDLSVYEWFDTPSNPDECGFIRYAGDGTHVWNPLTDDGDALRLAVSLGLVVDCSRPSAGLPFYSHLHAEIGIEDWNAGTRRAIVRAAAEIARGRP